MADLVTKLLPILHVADPASERDFYVGFGLWMTYEGSEYPGFIAVGNDEVEFGLTRREDADPAAAGVTWQLGVRDIDEVLAVCGRLGLDVEVEVERPRPDWTYRVVTVVSPNGVVVHLEEQTPSSDRPAGDDPYP
jgi:hypothetical protein